MEAIEPLIIVKMNDADAKLFIEFQRLHKNIELLTNSKMFDIRNGSAVIHFDNDGNIGKIERFDTLFDIRRKA